MATAVISASEGMHYLHGIIPAIDITITTVIVLVAFTGLAILGIGESASSNNFYNSFIHT
jgi:hypothetical protein